MASLNVEFSPSHCSHVVPFFCLLLKREVKFSQMKTLVVDLHFSENKEELKGAKKNLKEVNL